MAELRNLLGAVLAVGLLCVVIVSCSGAPSRSVPLSRLEYFRVKQASTMTTHGRVLAEDAQEVDGQIQYQTEQAGTVRTWRVTAEREADGTYRYGDPVEVKD